MSPVLKPLSSQALSKEKGRQKWARVVLGGEGGWPGWEGTLQLGPRVCGQSMTGALPGLSVSEGSSEPG